MSLSRDKCVSGVLSLTFVFTVQDEPPLLYVGRGALRRHVRVAVVRVVVEDHTMVKQITCSDQGGNLLRAWAYFCYFICFFLGTVLRAFANGFPNFLCSALQQSSHTIGTNKAKVHTAVIRRTCLLKY